MSQLRKFESEPPNPPGSTLHKLIRSKATKAFLTSDGLWTKKVQNAARFLNHSLALDAVHKFQLRDVELYYLFSECPTPDYDFTIALN